MKVNDNHFKTFFGIQLITLIIVIIILVDNLSISGNIRASVQPNENEIAVKHHKVEIISANDYIFGDSAAKNFLIIYSNYNCEYCHYFYKHVFDSLYQFYVLTGKLKIICKNLVDTTDKKGLLMAKIAEVGRQTHHFREIHQLFIASPNSIDSIEILALSRQAGISEEELTLGLNSKQILDKINNDNLSAKELNITGTPSFVLNGSVHLGYLTYNDVISKL